MEDVPDYSKNSLEELLDVEQRINKDKFPAAYAALQRELDARRERGERVELRFGWFDSPWVALPLAGVGAYFPCWALSHWFIWIFNPFLLLFAAFLALVSLLCFLPLFLYLKRDSR